MYNNKLASDLHWEVNELNFDGSAVEPMGALATRSVKSNEVSYSRLQVRDREASEKFKWQEVEELTDEDEEEARG